MLRVLPHVEIPVIALQRHHHHHHQHAIHPRRNQIIACISSHQCHERNTSQSAGQSTHDTALANRDSHPRMPSQDSEGSLCPNSESHISYFTRANPLASKSTGICSFTAHFGALRRISKRIYGSNRLVLGRGVPSCACRDRSRP
jgi:hypothetical protein